MSPPTRCEHPRFDSVRHECPDCGNTPNCTIPAPKGPCGTCAYCMEWMFGPEWWLRADEAKAAIGMFARGTESAKKMTDTWFTESVTKEPRCGTAMGNRHGKAKGR